LGKGKGWKGLDLKKWVTKMDCPHEVRSPKRGERRVLSERRRGERVLERGINPRLIIALLQGWREERSSQVSVRDREKNWRKERMELSL